MDSSEGKVKKKRVLRKPILIAGHGADQIAFDPSVLGQCVRIRRHALGIDQVDFAKKLNAQSSATRNYSVPWVSRLENGEIRRQLTDVVLQTIADALEVDVDMLHRAYLGKLGNKIDPNDIVPLQARGVLIAHPFIEEMFARSGIVGILTTGLQHARQLCNGLDVVILAPSDDPKENIVLLLPPGQEAASEAFCTSFNKLLDLVRFK